jgi:hypothetical protein
LWDGSPGRLKAGKATIGRERHCLKGHDAPILDLSCWAQLLVGGDRSGAVVFFDLAQCTNVVLTNDDCRIIICSNIHVVIDVKEYKVIMYHASTIIIIIIIIINNNNNNIIIITSNRHFR